MKELSLLWEQIKGLWRRPKDIEEIREDFQEFLEDLKAEEAISPAEEELLLRVIDLKELELGDFLIPRPDILWLKREQPWTEVKSVIAKEPHHYYPVFKEMPENYLGYVSLKDLVRGITSDTFDWLALLRKPLTLPKTLSAITALEKMKINSVELVFVVDDNSEFIGVVFLKDIIDEICYVKEECVAELKEGGYILPGKTKLRILERCLNLQVPQGDCHTISGLIMEHFKGIPPMNTKINFETFDIEILDADERRVKLVKIKPKA